MWREARLRLELFVDDTEAAIAFYVRVELDFLRPYSVAVGAAVLALNAYDKWLWKIPWLRYVPRRPPNISGTWKGELQSEYKAPNTGNRWPAIQVFLVVEQTASSISIRQITEESGSQSLTASLKKSAGMWVATYSYLNEPKLSHQRRSPMHLGTGVLNIHGSPPTSIDGQYWTSRDSKGEMEFTQHTKKIYTKFEDAQQDEKLAS